MAARYHFKLNGGYSDITANHNFQTSCFDSIREGNPLMVPIEGSLGSLGYEISCLEYILDAVIDSGGEFVDEDLFGNLAHPTLDLTQNLCHTIDDSDVPFTCIPKVIDAYVSVSSNGFNTSREKTNGSIVSIDKDVSRKNLTSDIKKITSRYQSDLRETTCRPHSARSRYGDSRDQITCFEKLLGEAQGMEFDVNSFPDDYFDYPMCHFSSGGSGMEWCFKRIISAATSMPSYSRDNTWHYNSVKLLDDMIASKKFERQLYELPICEEKSTCLDNMLYPHQSTVGAAPIETILNTYTDSNGVIDTDSEHSPFSGEKCHYIGYDSGYENCLDTAIRGISRLFEAYEQDTKQFAEKLANMVYSQLQYNSECGTLKFITLLSTTSPEFSRASTAAYVDKIAPNVIGDFKTPFSKIESLNCMSKLKQEHEVKGIDYALELGSPINYLLYRGGFDQSVILNELNKEPCKSVVTGDKIPCLQKLTKELMVDYSGKEPQLNGNTKYMIEKLLSGGENVNTILYPKDGTYFTDYITDGLYHSIIVNAGTAMESISLLDFMIRRMADHSEFYGIKFRDTEEHQRVGRIYDIIEEANRRYPENEHSLRFRNPTPIRYALDKMCDNTDEDVIKALKSGLFTYGKSKSITEVLASWYDQFKGNDEIVGLMSKVMSENKAVLNGYFKAYTHAQQNVSKPDKELNLTAPVIELFEKVYGKPMSEYFKPSLETRMLYDEMCFNTPGVDDKEFLENIYDDIPRASKLRNDPKKIVGVYDVMVGKSGEWSKDHILRYADVVSKILYGSQYPIGEPYIIRAEKMRPVPVGLIDAVNAISDYEYIGKRTDNVRGKLTMQVFPQIRPEMISGNPDYVVNTFKNEKANDFIVDMYYTDITGNALPQLRNQFTFREALQKFPKKFKNKLQATYPYLFGQIDAVIAKEIDEKEKPDQPDVSAYKLVISNKPADIIRSSGCQQWDSISCMSIFGGSHNESLESYLNGGSYIAYLTKKSEYEPQWLARLYMHQCENCNCVSIQDRLRYYEIERTEGRKYPNWHLLYDAVRVVLAEKGVNNISHTGSCDFPWSSSGSTRDDIMNYGDPRCDDEMEERTSNCISECEDDCDTDRKLDDYRDEISGEVSDEIERRFEEAKLEHTITNEDGDEELDIDEDELREEVEQDVYDTFEDELLGEKIQDCKDGCDSDCEYINEDFDCIEYLADIGELDDDDSDVWTDSDDIKPMKKDSSMFKGILFERTGQDTDESKFIVQAKSDF